MATSYPGGIDSLTNPTGANNLDDVSVLHSAQHANANDAIEAIETELGTAPSASYDSVAARLTAIEGGALTVVSTKGDLLAATANDTVTRLPVGTVGQVLGVDSTASTGLAWRSPGATNLLTADDASLESSVGTWVDAGGAAGGVARSTAKAYVGSASLLVTMEAAGNGEAMTGYQPVSAGRVYTVSAYALQGTGSRTGRIRILWYAGTSYLSQTVGSDVTLNGSTWSRALVAGVAPATATQARAVVGTSASGSASDAIYFDAITFHEGAGGSFALPGEPIQGLGTYVDESVGRRIFTWDPVNSRWQMTYGDTGVRDIAASLVNGWTAPGVVALARQGNIVTLYPAQYINGGSRSSGVFLTIPAGFRPTQDSWHAIGGDDGAGLLNIATNGVCTAYLTGAAVRFSVTLRTNDAWPTVLPGSASGSIPAS